jgi:hypothetical protein
MKPEKLDFRLKRAITLQVPDIDIQFRGNRENVEARFALRALLFFDGNG